MGFRFLWIDGCLPTRGWTFVAAGAHKRLPNGILGLLCREHFPGLVTLASVTEPAYTFEHYVAAPDELNLVNKVYGNKAERVMMEFWDFFRLEDGYDERTAVVLTKACKKRITDMHYEARLQAIISYHAIFLGEKVAKDAAREKTLTQEQYLKAWVMMVDRWLSVEWAEAHSACRYRRLMMPGAAHHQGNLSLDGYAARWSASHGNQPCSQIKAWAMAHKGKATSSVNWHPEDPAELYTNETVHERVSQYTEMTRTVYGSEYDPSTADLDGEIVMRVGGGKKHGRYWIGNNTLDSPTTSTLSEIRARGTSASPAIRPRPDTETHQVVALQAQLDQERKQWEEMEARIVAEWEAERMRMDAMIAYVTSLGASMGRAPPPELFAAPTRPPYQGTPNQLAASNEVLPILKLRCISRGLEGRGGDLGG